MQGFDVSDRVNDFFGCFLIFYLTKNIIYENGLFLPECTLSISINFSNFCKNRLCW
jgi:hypothetical protein